MTPLEYIELLNSPWIKILKILGILCFVGFFWSMISLTLKR